MPCKTFCLAFLTPPFYLQAPLYVGENVRARAEVLRFHPSKPIVFVRTQCFNDKGDLLMDGEAVTMIRQELYDASMLKAKDAVA